MTTEFRSETTSIDINDNHVTIVDDGGTYEFDSVSDAVSWCQQVIDAGRGEWWVEATHEALAFLMQHA